MYGIIMSTMLKQKYNIILIIFFLILSPFIFMNTGIGQDDAAIMLAAMQIQEYHWIRFSLENIPIHGERNIFFMLFNYSHGFMTLLVSYVIYYMVNIIIGIRLNDWLLIFPSTFSIFLTSFILYKLIISILHNKGYALIGIMLFATTPIILGLMRSYTPQLSVYVLVQTLYFYFILRYIHSEGEKKYKNLSHLMSGVVICSENTFFITIALGWLFVFIYYLMDEKKIKNAFKQQLEYFSSIYILFPLVILMVYIIAYYIEIIQPFGIGFFRHLFMKTEGVSFGVDEKFVGNYFSNLGLYVGFAGIFAPLLFIYIRKHIHKKMEPIAIVLFLWVIIRLVLCFVYQPRSNAFLYACLAVTPMIVLSLWAVKICLEKTIVNKKYIPLLFASAFILFNFIQISSVVFDEPFVMREIYGSARSYKYSDTYKAVGWVLRKFESYRPENIRVKLEGSDGWTVTDKKHWDITMAGVAKDPNKISYHSILYWGTDVTEWPNKNTRIIVLMNDYKGDIERFNKMKQYVMDNEFNEKYQIVDQSGDKTASIYTNYKVDEVKSFAQDYASKMWNDDFGFLYNLKTSTAHAL